MGKDSAGSSSLYCRIIQQRFLQKIFHDDFHGGGVRHRNPFCLRMLGPEPGILTARKLPCCRRNPVMQFLTAQFPVQIFGNLTVAERLPRGRSISEHLLLIRSRSAA